MSSAPPQLYPVTQLAAIINLLHRMAIHTPALPHGMTASQLSTIAFLRFSQGAQYQRDLEAFFKLRRSTVSSQLNTLERKGLLRRVAVSHDARLKQLVLTEEGIRFHENTILSFHQTDDYVANLLTEEENAELLRLLNKLRDALK